jgi:hypothetical protein
MPVFIASCSPIANGEAIYWIQSRCEVVQDIYGSTDSAAPAALAVKAAFGSLITTNCQYQN